PTETPPTEEVPTEDYDKSQLVSSGQTAHPQDTKRNIQLAVKGFHSPLDEDIRKSQPFPESKPTDPKDSGGNDQPVDKGLPSTVLDEGTGKTTPLSEGPCEDKDLERLKPLTDMESQTSPVTNFSRTSSEVKPDTQTLLLTTTADVQALLLSDDELDEESDNDVFEAGDEMNEGIQQADEEETQSYQPSKESSTKVPTKKLVSHEHHEMQLIDYNTWLKGILKKLKEVQDAAKEDPALIKKVLEATKAYNKNFTNLIELLTLDRILPQAVCQQQHLLSPKVQKLLGRGDDFTHTAIEEPPSHTDMEKDDMDTEEEVEKEATKEPEVENIMQEPVRASRKVPITIKLVKASSKVRPGPDEPVRVPYMIHGKMYQLTNDEIQEHMDKEEKTKKVAEEAKLLEISKP
nr:hypothetical protein [Tanacetum cinerariifolium]